MIQCKFQCGDVMTMAILVRQCPEQGRQEADGDQDSIDLHAVMKIKVTLQSPCRILISLRPLRDCMTCPDSAQGSASEGGTDMITTLLDGYALLPADRQAVLTEIEEFLREHLPGKIVAGDVQKV